MFIGIYCNSLLNEKIFEEEKFRVIMMTVNLKFLLRCLWCWTNSNRIRIFLLLLEHKSFHAFKAPHRTTFSL